MAERWTGPVQALAALDSNAANAADLIIDALFGAGLSRPLSAGAAEAVARCNKSGASGRLVLAVDVPSGLDGNTGTPCGAAAITATRTVTFFRPKPGHLLLPGRRLCGRVTVADIGIPPSVLDAIAPRTFANGTDLWSAAYTQTRIDGHKYSRGHAVVVSGPPLSTGAARLGARGALRVGAGLVTVVGSPEASLINAHLLTAIMVSAVTDDRELAAFLADRRRNAVLFGPAAGVGPATVARAETVLAAAHAGVVLDADALTSIAGDGSGPSAGSGGGPAWLSAQTAGRAAGVVLTPHDGEFARLFGGLAGLKLGSKLDRARAAAAASGATVVLKGADTVIASPDGRAAINTNAPPWLATAGSGDVLAGFIAGLLAQGMPAWEAACAGVWLHGEAANRFGPGLIAEDLPEALPGILRDQRVLQQSDFPQSDDAGN
jgi:NAD(P)H-hydrate epimerase